MTLVSAASLARINLYFLVSLNGAQEKDTGPTGQSTQPLLGESNSDPQDEALVGNPGLMIKLWGIDHGLRIVWPVAACRTLARQ